MSEPFNPSTMISFALPQARRALLNVYHEISQLVYTLVDHEMAAGRHSVHWNGQDQLGNYYDRWDLFTLHH